MADVPVAVHHLGAPLLLVAVVTLVVSETLLHGTPPSQGSGVQGNAVRMLSLPPAPPQARRTQPRPLTWREIVAMKWERGEHRGLNKLLLVHISGGIVRHAPTDGVAWPTRAAELIGDLRNATRLPDATFGVSVHGGCSRLGGLHFAYTEGGSCDSVAAPLSKAALEAAGSPPRARRANGTGVWDRSIAAPRGQQLAQDDGVRHGLWRKALASFPADPTVPVLVLAATDADAGKR